MNMHGPEQKINKVTQLVQPYSLSWRFSSVNSVFRQQVEFVKKFFLNKNGAANESLTKNSNINCVQRMHRAFQKGKISAEQAYLPNLVEFTISKLEPIVRISKFNINCKATQRYKYSTGFDRSLQKRRLNVSVKYHPKKMRPLLLKKLVSKNARNQPLKNYEQQMEVITRQDWIEET